jgi:hypothetical protein
MLSLEGGDHHDRIFVYLEDFMGSLLAGEASAWIE